MRVYLSAQVFSSRVCHMIKVYLESFEPTEMEAKKKEYPPLLEIIENIDHLIDIWNGKTDCEWINKPDHRHITELQLILELFREWREECDDKIIEFIPNQSWEDLC